jgi:MscS family membrane protein
MKSLLSFWIRLIFVLVPSQALADLDVFLDFKTDHPRDTVRTFMSAMNEYKKGVDEGDEGKKSRIFDALRTLDLGDIPFVLRDERGREIAQVLKEVIDRVILIDYGMIPDSSEMDRWRLKNTEMIITRVQEGDRIGEFLFSRETVSRAQSFYQRVKHLPYLAGSGGGAYYQEPWVDRAIPDWAQSLILGFKAWQWIGLFLSIFIGLTLKAIVTAQVLFVARLAEKSKFKWDEGVTGAFKKPAGWIAAGTFWFLSIHLLRFEGMTLTALTFFVQIFLSFVLIWTVYRLADVLTVYLKLAAEKSGSQLDDHLVPLIQKSLRIFLVAFGFLAAIQNLGFNVMSVLAGLGLGGLAFALAARDTCANLFGSVMILLDKPFGVGDWISIDGMDGTVEEVGFRSTRIRTFYNSVLSIPNAVTANAKIDNYGKREFRRVKAHFGLTYDTPPEKMEAFLEGVKNIIKANPHTRKDFLHVVFNGYADAHLDVMAYFFLKVPNWSQELVERQNVFLEVLRLAKRVGVEFAFPTQTLHIETFPEKKQVRPVHTVNEEDLRAGASDFALDGNLSRPDGLGIFVPPYREKELTPETVT